MEFTNSYARLPDAFFQRTAPTPVRAPRLFLWNEALALELGIATELSADPERLAQLFCGNRELPGSEPIATAYAGHQFGHFVPQLGDGRAHLLGEVLDCAGQRREIQLKGSGRSAFSRGGDGRCALGPAIREFLMSEALHALGVPTTRSLAVVLTGEPVRRETALPGAVVTRVASSHVRVGTFEYFAARRDVTALERLADYTIARHYPELTGAGQERFEALLTRAIARHVELVTQWMRIGFIHGVMNTDNTALSGETIDYGPCAMLSVYDPSTVFSSIDQMGRYAFGNQPAIMQWNMARLAECLLPLVDADEQRAAARLASLIDDVAPQFQQAWLQMMSRKLGLFDLQQGDGDLVTALLERLQQARLDYTITFRRLAQAPSCDMTRSELSTQLGPWLERWEARLGAQPQAREAAQQAMQGRNPAVIPRNHHVEATLAACNATLDAEPARRFLEALRTPYEELPQTRRYQDAPPDGDKNYRTFCGT